MNAATGATVTAYVGIGANLEDPIRQVRTAIEEIAALPDCSLQQSSSLYRTSPMGPADQPDYINAVVAVVTGRAPLALLASLQGIERTHGRVRVGERWGPRTLDLDLLLYDELQYQDAQLTVPHAGLADRAFVLVPLHEIAPALMIPGKGALAELLSRVDPAGIARL